MLLELFIAALIFAVTPGPGTLAVLSTTLQQGPHSGIWLSLGETLGDLFYLTLALFSLGLLAEILAPMMEWIRLLGGSYLIYLGVRQWRAATQWHSDVVPARGVRSLLIGVLISGTNPKVVIFYLSFLPLFIDLQGLSLEMALQVMLVVALAIFSGLMLMVLFSAQLKRMLQHPHQVGWLNRISGGLMVGVGGVVAQSTLE